MNRRLCVGIGLGAVVALGWLGGCSGDNHIGPAAETSPPRGVVVSDPEPQANAASRAGSLSSLNDNELVYIAVYPGTVPHAASVAIENPLARFALTASATDGGIDPVPGGDHEQRRVRRP